MRELRAREVAFGARILAVIERAVDPFEKSKSLISAWRTRLSAKSGRRVLNTSADMPAGIRDRELFLDDRGRRAPAGCCSLPSSAWGRPPGRASMAPALKASNMLPASR